MKKIIASLLSFSLLLSVLVGCQSEPEPEPVTMIWTYKDYKVEQFQNAGASYLLRELVDDPETADALFYIAIEDNGEGKEWPFEAYTATKSEKFGTQIYVDGEPYRDYIAATVTKEELTELVENESLVMQLTVPPRPEGYVETISDSLAATLAYDPQETYPIRVYTLNANMSSIYVGSLEAYVDRYDWSIWNPSLTPDGEMRDPGEARLDPPPYGITNDELKVYMDDLMKRYDLLGKYEGPLTHFDPSSGKMRPARDSNEEGYGGYMTADENENPYWLYYGWFETTATAEQILALAEDEDVLAVYPGLAWYLSIDHYVTTIKGNEVTSEFIKRTKAKD